jgi:hypothetical protein
MKMNERDTPAKVGSMEGLCVTYDEEETTMETALHRLNREADGIEERAERRTAYRAVATDTRVCHAPGDRCFGCEHYQGKAAECKYKGAAQSGVPVNAFCFFRDGDQWCCVWGDFKNLQESPAGFGETQDEACMGLVRGVVTPNV